VFVYLTLVGALRYFFMGRDSELSTAIQNIYVVDTIPVIAVDVAFMFDLQIWTNSDTRFLFFTCGIMGGKGVTLTCVFHTSSSIKNIWSWF